MQFLQFFFVAQTACNNQDDVVYMDIHPLEARLRPKSYFCGQENITTAEVCLGKGGSRDKGCYVLLTCFQVLKRKFPEFHYDFLKSIPLSALNTNIQLVLKHPQQQSYHPRQWGLICCWITILSVTRETFGSSTSYFKTNLASKEILPWKSWQRDQCLLHKVKPQNYNI